MAYVSEYTVLIRIDGTIYKIAIRADSARTAERKLCSMFEIDSGHIIYTTMSVGMSLA